MEIKVLADPWEIKTAWEELVPKTRTATFFQTYTWAEIWFKHFPQGKPYILAFWEKDLIALAPFLQKEKELSFWGTGEVLGKELVTDFGDIIIRKGFEEKVWREILRHLRNSSPKQILDLHFLREESPSFKYLGSKFKGNVEKEDVAPFLNLSPTWEDYLGSLGWKERHELKRKIRRLEKAGSFQICGPSDFKDGLDKFFLLAKISSLEKKDFFKPAMEDFFRDLVRYFAPSKMIDLCFLDFKGVKIAATLSLIENDEVLLYNSGFDPEFAHLAPGLILKAFLVKRAIEEGKKRFDFLRGDERYKYDLGGKDQNLYHLRIKNL